MQTITTSGISRRELMIFFYKFRRRLLFAFLIPFALGVFASTIPVPLFTAQSVLVVRLGSEYIYQPEVGTNPTSGSNSTIPFDREQIFKSEVAILSSHDLHQEVIRQIGLEKIFPEVITPSLSSRVRRFVLGGFMNYFSLKEKGTEELEQYRLAVATGIFDKRFDILLEKESAVINVSFEHSNRAIAVETLDTLLKLYFEKRKQLFLEYRAERAQSQMNAAKEQLQVAQRNIEEFKLKNQVFSLEDQRRQLLDKRSDAQRRATSINSQSLTNEIAQYNSELESLDLLEREFAALQKEVQLANDSYALTSRRHDDAKAFEELQQERSSSVRIIQPASAPPEPKRLKTLIMISGTMISLLITLLTAAISETSRRGFLTPEEAERNLNLPVLAVLPYTPHGK